MVRGVYFLANDRIIDRTITFLNSFRAFNPDIPMCMIPFSADIDQLRRLQSTYKFEVWSDEEALRYCDSVSDLFHGRQWGHFRKLALWAGEFDEFIYIDSDTVVLRNIDPILELLVDYGFICSLSDMPEIRKWVWRNSIDRVNTLTKDQKNYAASMGFICSAKRYLAVDDIARKVPEALKIAQHMELLCPEQGLMNYLIVTSEHRYTSLQKLSTAPEGDPRIPRERHCSEPFRTIQGQVVGVDSFDTLLVHWAGEFQAVERGDKEYMDHQELWNYYHSLNGPIS